MMLRRWLAALGMLAVIAAAGGPVLAEPPAPGPLPPTPAEVTPAPEVVFPPSSAAGPSVLADALRAGGATALVVLLLGGITLAWRRRPARRPARAAEAWWRRWLPAPPAERDRIELLARLALGARESIALVRIGRERLLLGATTAQIGLLARLDPAEAAPAEGPAGEFEAALAQAAPSVPRTSDDLRDALARSRERLQRLSGRPVNEASPRA